MPKQKEKHENYGKEPENRSGFSIRSHRFPVSFSSSHLSPKRENNTMKKECEKAAVNHRLAIKMRFASFYRGTIQIRVIAFARLFSPGRATPAKLTMAAVKVTRLIVLFFCLWKNKFRIWFVFLFLYIWKFE